MTRPHLVVIGLLGWLLLGSVCSAADLPSRSLYQLHTELYTQRGSGAAGLDLYRGHPTLISMFYGSCRAYCPMLVTAVQVYESHLDARSRARLRVLLVSFDAPNDTPQRLTEL